MEKRKYVSVPITYEKYSFLSNLKLRLEKMRRRRSLLLIVDTLISILQAPEAISITNSKIIIDTNKLDEETREIVINLFETAMRR